MSPTHQDETDVASGGINNDNRVDESYDDEGEDHDDEASFIEVDVTSIEVKTNSDHMSQSGDFEAQALLFHIKSRDEYLTSFPTPESWDALTPAAQKFLKGNGTRPSCSVGQMLIRSLWNITTQMYGAFLI